MAVSLPPAASCFLSILPWAVFGRDSVNSIYLGTIKDSRFSVQNFCTCLSVSCICGMGTIAADEILSDLGVKSEDDDFDF